jgi:hypothetical protein
MTFSLTVIEFVSFKVYFETVCMRGMDTVSFHEFFFFINKKSSFEV